MAGSITDIFSAMQNGVVALGNFKKQLAGSFNNISTQLATKAPSSAVLASSTAFVASIAGNSGAFTLNGASGITNTVNDILLSQGSTSQFGAVKADGTTVTVAAGVLSAPSSQANLSPITKSTSADVLLNNTATFFDGPSVAQGSSGTWFASGSIFVTDTAGAANITVKLWDGTTVIASGNVFLSIANVQTTIALSGFLTSPASNLKISAKDSTSTSGKILFNTTGASNDSTITAIRVA